jgi:hypothetical protein
MPAWTIRCFRSERGRDLFVDQYRGQTVKARAMFRATINVLRDQPDIQGWSRVNGFDRLTGKKYRRYHGLGKLLFKADGVQHRPLGFFGPTERSFTLLIWATERNWEFYPPSVLGTALDRMGAVTRNPERAGEFHF